MATSDVVAADWSLPQNWINPEHGGPYRLAWIIPPPGAGSGGHHNIFRFIRHLESRGHTCEILVYDPDKTRSEQRHRANIDKHFAPMKARVSLCSGYTIGADAIIATGWETAYPALVNASTAKRFYFVQDFEPYFSPVGSASVLAENTYRFGFHGITAGNWLKQKLESDFGMQCDAYSFGVDTDHYHLTNTKPRSKVFFYARPPTPRRAWELGVMALTLFHQKHPDVEIHLAGWKIHSTAAEFPFHDHGIIDLRDLNDFYNEMSAGLVLSMTNCSLLPLELLASGCIPILNDAPNNRLVVENPFISWTDSSPQAIAQALSEAIFTATPERHKSASQSVTTTTWGSAEERVEQTIVDVLRG